MSGNYSGTCRIPSEISYSAGIEKVLMKSGKNRPELEKAISYFKKGRDQQKIQAIYFLIANMDIHYSANYFWADSSGRRIPFNELNYPSYKEALDSFDQIKKQYIGVHPQAYSYKDIDSVKSQFLIDNVERAFKYWKIPRIKNLSFSDFCEYVLPYRVSVEPLENWREAFEKKYRWVNDSAKGKNIEETLHLLANDTKSWFTNTWQLGERKEPLPRLGALQLLSRAKGNCEDIAGLEVFSLRSQGYPAAVDHIPFWATSAGTHFFNNTLDENLKPLPFDVSTNEVKINNFSREPSKVIRETYSKQPSALASFTKESDIPPGFMRMQNTLDVTALHWETTEVTCSLSLKPLSSGLAYACVFSGGKWQPTWWGKTQGQSVTFTNMCKGVVYLPVYYSSNKLIVAGQPVVCGYKRSGTLQPDTTNKHTVKIASQDRYLIFRPGKKYKLYYWNYGWKLLGEKTPMDNAQELAFESVPNNALMILIPEYSQGKERPFTISPDGDRQWW